MKNGDLFKCNKKTARLIDSTKDLELFKHKYELFDYLIMDMSRIEWWEDRLQVLGINSALIQFERHRKDGTIRVRGYNIITESVVNRGDL